MARIVVGLVYLLSSPTVLRNIIILQIIVGGAGCFTELIISCGIFTNLNIDMFQSVPTGGGSRPRQGGLHTTAIISPRPSIRHSLYANDVKKPTTRNNAISSFLRVWCPPNDVVPRDGQLMQMERRGEDSIPGLGTGQTPDPGT